MGDHRWFHPYPGANLRCRSCGMWHAVAEGDDCVGEQDWPQPALHVLAWEPTDLSPGSEFVAKVRCVGFHGNQVDVVIEPSAS